MTWTKRTKSLLAVGALGMTSVVLLTGFAGHRFGRRDPQQLGRLATARVDNWLDDLDATDAQRTKIQALKDSVLSQAFRELPANDAAREELLAQWRSSAPDRAKLHALVDQRAEAFRALAHQAADALLDTHATLTPQQRAEVAQQLQAHRH
jgi:periplasmic protein CpxP/Spy